MHEKLKYSLFLNAFFVYREKSHCLKITIKSLILQNRERSELLLYFEWTKVH